MIDTHTMWIINYPDNLINTSAEINYCIDVNHPLSLINFTEWKCIKIILHIYFLFQFFCFKTSLKVDYNFEMVEVWIKFLAGFCKSD